MSHLQIVSICLVCLCLPAGPFAQRRPAAMHVLLEFAQPSFEGVWDGNSFLCLNLPQAHDNEKN